MDNPGKSPVIVVHGGAWAIPDHLYSSSLSGVQSAARAGWRVLDSGGNSLDAVEAAVTVLEDDPTFDAGTGSVLTSAETIEMDSIIMEGALMKFGAVACVSNIKNPIKLARHVLEKTDHTMLVGKGANDFASEIGLPKIPQSDLITPEVAAEFQKFKTFNKSVVSNFSQRQLNGSGVERNEFGHDTVGCVALDCSNSFACGTSTGGITGKRLGRVGDSPIVGCGGYAEDGSGAVSCTGHGESISRVCLARRILENCEQGLKSDDAIRKGLEFMSGRIKNSGSGGAICIDKNGIPGINFNSERMAWAIIRRENEQSEPEGLSGVNPNEIIKFSLNE